LRGDAIGLPSQFFGQDTFVLGDADNVFYAAAGIGDYALIRDFQDGLDKLQVNGSFDYTLAGGEFGGVNSAFVIATNPSDGASEVIGILQGVTSITVNPFVFA